MKKLDSLQVRDFVRDTLSTDCRFIFEALNKLIEGTCCTSQDENQICTWDLLPRVYEALREHIAFEEKWLFSELPPEELRKHQLEHEKLQRLLASAEWELECGYGDLFKSILHELKGALIQHHLLDSGTINCNEKSMDDQDLEKIKARLKAPWMADQAS